MAVPDGHRPVDMQRMGSGQGTYLAVLILIGAFVLAPRLRCSDMGSEYRVEWYNSNYGYRNYRETCLGFQLIPVQALLLL